MDGKMMGKSWDRKAKDAYFKHAAGEDATSWDGPLRASSYTARNKCYPPPPSSEDCGAGRRRQQDSRPFVRKRYYYDSPPSASGPLALDQQPIVAVKILSSPRLRHDTGIRKNLYDSPPSASGPLALDQQPIVAVKILSSPRLRHDTGIRFHRYTAEPPASIHKADEAARPKIVAQIDEDTTREELLPVGTIMFRIFGKRRDVELLYGPDCTSAFIRRQLANGTAYDDIGKAGGKHGGPICARIGLHGDHEQIMLKVRALVDKAIQERERLPSYHHPSTSSEPTPSTTTDHSSQDKEVDFKSNVAQRHQNDHQQQQKTQTEIPRHKKLQMEKIKSSLINSIFKEKGPNYDIGTYAAGPNNENRRMAMDELFQRFQTQAEGKDPSDKYITESLASLENYLLNADPFEQDIFTKSLTRTPEKSQHQRKHSMSEPQRPIYSLHKQSKSPPSVAMDNLIKSLIKHNHHHHQPEPSSHHQPEPSSHHQQTPPQQNKSRDKPDAVKFISRDDAPYHALIYAAGRFACGGAIVQRFWILTSANCAIAPSDLYEVYAGRTTKDQHQADEQRFGVSKIYVHENFNRSALGSDIALLQLSKPVHFNAHVTPAQLPNAGVEPMPGQTMRLTGFGFNNSTSDALKTNLAAYISDWECEFLLSSNNVNGSQKIEDSQLCTLGPNDAADAGNPLVTVDSKTLEGIVSYTVVGGQDPLPIVYTQVSHFLTWMSSKMSNAKN
ncbi:unnamed protein product [Notodromas monacha]|uniref:Peptidase S1 domain-containing protein n=1 Tax=Notodromas monacha TaxID=399045 RepID=A0A7R9BNH9_9CRUS|nr:unnamed protein product [Notodromas monacha]CAG0917909.1 unnamed protein product [Notodromas monacha]